MNLDEIQQIFFQECEEGLSEMESSFASIQAGGHDAETINSIFRCVHSIKGGAGAFGHELLQKYTHQYETLLDLIRSEAIELTDEILNTIIAAFDILSDHVLAVRDGEESPADAEMLSRLSAASVKPGEEAPEATAAIEDNVADAPEESSEKGETLDVDDQSQPQNSGNDLDDLFEMLGESTAATKATEEDVDADPMWILNIRPAAKAFDNGSEPLLLLRELSIMGAVTKNVDLSALPELDAMDPDCSYLAWTIELPGTLPEENIHEVFEFVDGYTLSLARSNAETASVSDSEAPKDPVAEAPEEIATPSPDSVVTPEIQPVDEAIKKQEASPPVPAKEKAPRQMGTAGQTIRVDLDKLDRLVNLVGEMVITQAMLTQRLSGGEAATCSEMMDLDHLTRELQESTMAIRAQPMKTVFNRIPRIIRELEGETGKKVRLDLEGELTEVDKTVVERIGEPLTHLIRNAVDHGLESTEERLAAGKPEEGIVSVAAAQHSGRIVITVSDDGKGIDCDAVRAKAVERGLIQADAVMSDEEIYNLILAPGFSTATKVSNVSGRGVGMDVVRKNVQALGGRIGIQSKLGSGSSFSLSLPLTLAILDGMIVSVGDQTFVVPLSHIVESLRPNEDNVSLVGPDTALLDVRGNRVPIHHIGKKLGIEGGETNPSKAVLIVVDGDHGEAVLMVDAIQDQRQVVVKSLEANYAAVDGLAGATILGNGQVSLILDVDALTIRSRPSQRSGASNLAAAA